MTIISVNAEHTYEVILSNLWTTELVRMCEGRTRVAVIVSTAFTPDLSALRDLEADLHVFEVPDGEDCKNVETISKIWNWLGAAGFTRSDLIVGEPSPI